MRCALSLLAFVLLSACASSGGSCRTMSECADSELCVDGRCVPRSRVDAGVVDAFLGPDAGTSACPSCAAGEVCVVGACCSIEQACADRCCGGAEVCSFDECVAIGEPCRSEDDCTEDRYCEPRLGTDGATCDGAPIPSGRCLPRPPRCPDGTLPDPTRPTCIASCTYEPTPDAFDVQLRYAWGAYDGDPAEPNATDVRSSPIVIQMDDDDCDGRITGRDVPEIVVTVSPNDVESDGTTPRLGDLVVLSVADGELREKARATAVAHAWTYLAAGEIDGTEGNEIVVCAPSRRRVLAYGLDGGALAERWGADVPGNCYMPVLADLDQDGRVEVLAGGIALAGEDGSVRFTFAPALGGEALAADVDGDAEHRLEVVTGNRIYRQSDATTFSAIASLTDNAGAFPLVADLELGGLPEIVSVHNPTHTMTVWRYDGAGGAVVVRGGLDINGTLDPSRCGATSAGRTQGGGPPTAADVNADGVPDIAVAGGVGYAVLDGARLVDSALTDLETFLWTRDTIDCSSASTGSSVFDFNGDGRAEVLYADEHWFRIYDGISGDVLFDACNTNGTIQETPIVADVDGNGEADVVVVANAVYRACMDDTATRVSGVRVYGSGDGRWVRTRPVWNQHGYHVTNVEADGTIPTREAPNWATSGLDNYRQNRQPGNETSAVDAVLALRPRCSAPTAVIATVRNLGESVLPPGATVRLYRGTGASGSTDLVAEVATTVALHPAQAEDVVLAITDDTILFGVSAVHAIVVVPGEVPECRADNNLADGLTALCLI